MTKIDFKKELKKQYSALVNRVKAIEVPKLNYIMIEGKGDPNTDSSYSEAITALYALAYAIKFKIKKSSEEIDYGVMPLETLWWEVEGSEHINEEAKGKWCWKILIMQPDFVTCELVEDMITEVSQKKKIELLGQIKFETLEEGLVAQIMHVGPYNQEQDTIARLHQFIEEEGYEFCGLHHEIYLNDPRRTAKERLKTIIRQPIK